MDDRVDADEVRQRSQRYRPPSTARGVQRSGEEAERLRCEQRRLEIDDFLLFGGGWPCAVALRVGNGGIQGLVCQVALERPGIVRIEDFGGAREWSGFPA